MLGLVVGSTGAPGPHRERSSAANWPWKISKLASLEPVTNDPIGFVLPGKCQKFVASGLKQVGTEKDGDGGDAWLACSHAARSGLNFDVGLAQGIKAIADKAAAQAGKPGVKVLELGAGLGLYADWVAKSGHKVVAVEPEPMHTTTYDFESNGNSWPRQLAVDLFTDEGASCAAALPKYEVVYSVESLEHMPIEMHSTVMDTIANISGGFLVFSAAHPGQGGTGHVSERAPLEWQDEWAQRGFEYLPKTSALLRHHARSPNHQTNIMAFAAAGAPLGRAVDDASLSVSISDEEDFYEPHPAARGAEPLRIGDKQVGVWRTRLTHGEVKTWPKLIEQLSSHCFDGEAPAHPAMSQDE